MSISRNATGQKQFQLNESYFQLFFRNYHLHIAMVHEFRTNKLDIDTRN